MGFRHRALAIALVAGLLTPLVATATSAAPAAAQAAFTVRGSLEQVFVIGAPVGSPVELHDATGAVVASGTTDAQGGLVLRSLAAGEYTIAVGDDAPVPVTVQPRDWVPPQSFYDGQTLANGYGYLEARDGTTLGVQVALPGPADAGPYPTLVEYSGYDPSNPANEANLFKIVAGIFGYAYVGVNIRGSGCSGGSFSYFEWLQSTDGYDAIETVAAQPWSGRVGMVGISYPGISQLFVAQTQPPNLAAITPLSVIADTFRSTLYPGGIFNDGFALDWATDRFNSNRWPGGSGWVAERVAAGDTECESNQQLRGQNPPLLDLVRDYPYYPAVGDPLIPDGGDLLAPAAFVDEIRVPTFMAGAWQDEQTGGHWSVLLDRFAAGTPVRVVATNGTHVDALGPRVLPSVIEFLQLYVGEEVPRTPDLLRFLIPAVYEQLFGVGGLTLPPDRFTGFADHASALAVYESEPPVRVLWENGGAPGTTPGAPVPSGETAFTQWPPAETAAQAWYLQPDGRLAADAAPVSDDSPRGTDGYTYDPSAKPRDDFEGGGSDIWRADATYDWRPLPDTNALAFLTEPFTADVAMAGSGSVDLWVQADAADADLEVTLTEVRPDGQERYVQNGWLRATHRALDDAASTELRPRQTHLEADAEPLPAGEWEPVRIELFPFAHVFRAGSQLRLAIETPGGNRPLWRFDVLDGDDAPSTVWVSHTSGRPSRVVLPVLDGVDAPARADGFAPCPSLRAQPCRPYVPSGAPTAVSARAAGDDGAVVDWTAPPSGGRVLSGYTVTAAPGGASHDVAADVEDLELTGLAPGAYAFTVAATYVDGATVPSTPSDLVAVGPLSTVMVTDGPTGVRRSTSATVAFSGDAALFACSLDWGPATPCASPVTIDVRPGKHVLFVLAYDESGTLGRFDYRAWEVRALRPSARITAGPVGVVATTDATFAFEPLRAGAELVCALDGGAPEPCAGEATYQDLAEGTHLIEVWQPLRAVHPIRTDFRYWTVRPT